MLRLTLIAAAAVSMMAGAASATVYTDQASFSAAHPGLATTNFDSYSSTVAQNGDIDFVGTPFTQGNVTFSSNGAQNGDELYITDANFFGGNYSTALGTNTFNATLTMAFAPTDAVGLTLASTYSGYGAELVNFQLFDGSTQLYDQALSINDMSAPSFVGFDNLGPITSIAATPLDTYGFATVVNVQGPGTVSAAPEPSVWMLMIAGVAMIGSALRLGRKRGVGSLSVA